MAKKTANERGMATSGGGAPRHAGQVHTPSLPYGEGFVLHCRATVQDLGAGTVDSAAVAYAEPAPPRNSGIFNKQVAKRDFRTAQKHSQSLSLLCRIVC